MATSKVLPSLNSTRKLTSRELALAEAINPNTSKYGKISVRNFKM